MLPTLFFGSGAFFQDPGPFQVVSSRRTIGISRIDSFGRALGVEIGHVCEFLRKRAWAIMDSAGVWSGLEWVEEKGLGMVDSARVGWSGWEKVWSLTLDR